MPNIVLWNGFPAYRKLQVFTGNEESAQDLADLHLQEGNDVIYFYGIVDTITLKGE